MRSSALEGIFWFYLFWTWHHFFSVLKALPMELNFRETEPCICLSQPVSIQGHRFPGCSPHAVGDAQAGQLGLQQTSVALIFVTHSVIADSTRRTHCQTCNLRDLLLKFISVHGAMWERQLGQNFPEAAHIARPGDMSCSSPKALLLSCSLIFQNELIQIKQYAN